MPTVVHAFTDGRDTPPQSRRRRSRRSSRAALPPTVPIATVSGRYYAMDRDKRWERVAKAYDAIMDAQGNTRSRTRRLRSPTPMRSGSPTNSSCPP